MAERARAGGRRQDAALAYTGALASGGLSRSEVAHAHLRLAELAYLEGEDDEGARHLRFALALRPDAPLSGAPPAMAALGAELLRGSRDAALRVVLEISDAQRPIRVDLRDAPEGLVRVVQVRGLGGFSRTLAWDGAAQEVPAPAEARPVGVRVLDAHGNVVGAAGVWPASPSVGGPLDLGVHQAATPAPGPVIASPGSVASTPEEGDEDLLESPWLWIAIGAVLVVVGVAVGFTASGDRFTVGAPVAP